ncbi:lipid kinase YegS [Lysobacteraceae bacterium NML71-0210]|nr:lipid kinase YegS [Xanthomonadaceae bacterium NML71-0210]
MVTLTPSLLILNGKAAQREEVRAAVEALRESGAQLAVRVTWEGGDVARFVDEAVALGARRVIAGGGDGSLNEAVNALMALPQAQRPALGILPLGTANDFAVAAEIPQTALEALQLAQTAMPIAVDLLRVRAGDETRWSLNLVTGGFGTQVTLETDPDLKKHLGGLAYFLTGLTRLGQMGAMQAQLRAENFEWQGEFVALAVGNGRQAGGGRVLCPDASLNDGLLDFTLVPEMPDGGQMLSMLGTALSEGREAALAQAALQGRGQWLEVSADEVFCLNLDGEPFEADAFRIDCMPAALSLCLPPASALLLQAVSGTVAS